MIKFQMKHVTSAMHGDKEKLYPQMIKTGDLSTKEIAKQISEASSFTEGDVRGMLEALREEIVKGMSMGFTVHVDGIGTFRPVLGLKDGAEAETTSSKNKKNSASVEIARVSFRPDRELISDVDMKAKIERVGINKAVKQPGSPFSPDERVKKAIDFIKKNGEMTSTQYAELTQMSLSNAQLELRKLRTGDNAPFKRVGERNRFKYVLK